MHLKVKKYGKGGVHVCLLLCMHTWWLSNCFIVCSSSRVDFLHSGIPSVCERCWWNSQLMTDGDKILKTKQAVYKVTIQNTALNRGMIAIAAGCKWGNRVEWWMWFLPFPLKLLVLNIIHKHCAVSFFWLKDASYFSLPALFAGKYIPWYLKLWRKIIFDLEFWNQARKSIKCDIYAYLEEPRICVRCIPTELFDNVIEDTWAGRWGQRIVQMKEISLVERQNALRNKIPEGSGNKRKVFTSPQLCSFFMNQAE